MVNLILALIPAPSLASGDHDEGFLGKIALWARLQGRYRQALHELNQLDDRDLDDLGIGRGDLPDLARRHVSGAKPLLRLSP